MDEESKLCRRCGHRKAPSEFYTVPKGDVGTCKECRSAQDRERYQANRDAILDRNRRYKDRKRDAIREQQRTRHREDPEYRERVRVRAEAWRRANPDRARDYWVEWYRNNADHIKAYNRARYEADRDGYILRAAKWKRDNPERAAEVQRDWAARHPEARRRTEAKRRARKRGGLVIDFTEEELRQRMSMFGDRCTSCGDPADQVDHVIPLALGGAHALANLRPICAGCNREKGSRPPDGRWLSHRRGVLAGIRAAISMI